MTYENTAPQVEDGHTRIANELLEAMCRAGFSARQWAVVMAVVRKTYGYGKKGDDIGLGQLEHMTGIDKGNLSRVVRELADMRVISRSEGMFGHKLAINKRYSQWRLKSGARGFASSKTGDHEMGLPEEQPGLPVQQPQNSLDVVAESATGIVDSTTVVNLTKLGLSNRQPQKETLQKKENIKPLSGNPDDAGDGSAGILARAAIEHLNAKTGSAYRHVESNLKLVRARLGEGATLDEVKAVIDAKVAEWAGDRKMAAYLRPSTLFNATNFAQYVGQLPRASAPAVGTPIGVASGSPLDIDTNPAWLAQTGYASVWEAISDGCTEYTFRQFRDGKRIPKEAA